MLNLPLGSDCLHPGGPHERRLDPMEVAQLLGRPSVFEQGDRIFLTTPLVMATPTAGQVEEMAFASAIKTSAPNEHIGWLAGKYVEGGRPNLNGAMWLNDELALKSLTPMLMPVTVMHDPRTAVGTIADCKLMNDPSAARIDTILAIWKHRFTDIWEEAEANLAKGELAQSMECFAPTYSCSSCHQQYVKLPNGAERSSWCSHLRGDDSLPAAARILSSVCFTGTGLIFGSRGGRPAYSDASLDSYREEIAEAHAKAHSDSTYRSTQRSTTSMSLVQIEESELKLLRDERNEARASVETLNTEKRDLTTKVEAAEAAKVAAESAKTEAEGKVTKLEESAQRATLKDGRLATLGTGFMAALGDTSKTKLAELAASTSDEEWDSALKEREEIAKVKRDAKAEPGATPPVPANGATPPAAPTFASEEVAAFVRGSTAQAAPSASLPAAGGSAVRALAKTFAKKPPVPAGSNQG